MNIASILSAQARERPNAAAVIHHETATFSELDRAAARFAAELESHGVRPGHFALILTPMSIDLYAVLIGCFRLRVVAMFLDPSFGRDYIEQCLEIQKPNVFVGAPKAHLLRVVSKRLREVSRTVIVSGAMLPGAWDWHNLKERQRDRIEECDDSTPALLTFTSGSTGKPKAAMRTHGFLLAQNRVLVRTLELKAGEVDMPALPVFVLANLASGVTSVIPDADLRTPGRIDPAPVIKQVESHDVRSIVAAPAFFERLLSAGPTLPNVSRLFTGGAPVFPDLLDRLAEACPNAKVTAVYGSTEAEPIAEIPRDEIAKEDIAAMKSGAGLLTGVPVSEIDLRIVKAKWGDPLTELSKDGFAAIGLPQGEAGEIVVAGDHVLSGYYRGEGDSETKFRVDGRVWHRTGDLGRLDNRGRLWLLGRASAKIEDDRGVLYPFTVECVVAAFKEVRRSAMLSVNGKRVLALDADAIPPELNESLAWAEIDEIKRCRIPVDKRHNSKVDYPGLLKRLGAKRTTSPPS